MGGCISSFMDRRNEASLIPHPILNNYRQYGMEASFIPGTETENSSPIYCFIDTDENKLNNIRNEFAGNCLWIELIEQRARALSSKPVMGYRVIEKIEKREVETDEIDSSDNNNKKKKKKILEYYHLSPVHTLTYAEMWEQVCALGRGLYSLNIPEKSIISIYEETRWEWMVAIYGIWTQNYIASTVYANLGEDALTYAIEETESHAIICSGKALPSLISILKKKKMTPILIYLDEKPVNLLDEGYTRIFSWADVISRGRALASTVPIHYTENKNNLALIMYTSGTTGNPKGVMHSQYSLSVGIAALNDRLLDLYKPVEDGEVYCAYLPLAHILEFALVNIFINRGTMIGFGSPRTLTSNFAIPHGDLTEYKPKVIIAVPRIFDTIKKSVESKLPAENSIKKIIFNHAYTARKNALIHAQDTPYYNEKIFRAARLLLGGNIYGMLSGGGPLSSRTQEFINIVCGGPLIIQGWGLTETVCVGATQRLGDLQPNCVGQVLKSVELKLLNTGEYKYTDLPNPRGEIALRGPFLFQGYYKQDQLTQEVLDKEGFFHTGDVGEIHPDGKINIIGRVKALAKNVLGEYIALEALEAIYAQHPLCMVNGVCLLVHPERSYIGALILTDPTRAMQFAKTELNFLKSSFPEILMHPFFHEKAALALAHWGKINGRKPFECIKVARVLNEEWTTENGMLTPTAKLRRGPIEAHYKDIIAELFAKEG